MRGQRRSFMRGGTIELDHISGAPVKVSGHRSMSAAQLHFDFQFLFAFSRAKTFNMRCVILHLPRPSFNPLLL